MTERLNAIPGLSAQAVREFSPAAQLAATIDDGPAAGVYVFHAINGTGPEESLVVRELHAHGEEVVRAIVPPRHIAASLDVYNQRNAVRRFNLILQGKNAELPPATSANRGDMDQMAARIVAIPGLNLESARAIARHAPLIAAYGTGRQITDALQAAIEIESRPTGGDDDSDRTSIGRDLQKHGKQLVEAIAPEPLVTEAVARFSEQSQTHGVAG